MSNISPSPSMAEAAVEAYNGDRMHVFASIVQELRHKHGMSIDDVKDLLRLHGLDLDAPEGA